MNDDEKREKLMKYLLAVERLKRKCDDAARWESMSFGACSSIEVHTRRQNQPDTIKDTAIQSRQECETLAIEVRSLRQELDAALSLMQNERFHAYLESKYIDGFSDRQLCERNNYSERHMRRLMTQAIRELDRCSSYFS